MKIALLVATGLTTISTAASAGGYLGLGAGPEAAMNSEMEKVATPSGRSLRVLAGSRFGNIAIEGALNGFGVIASRQDQTVYELSGALKLSIPFGNNFEGFARVGLERTWLDLGDSRMNLTGDGFMVAGGFEYRLDAVLANASLFVDYTVHQATLENSAGTTKVDDNTRVWGLGFTVGI